MARGHGTTCKTTKGYPRVTKGPLRHKYIHRIVAAALIGRELHKSEEVHHKDSDKLNFHHGNLLVYGARDHGWVSAKQAWYMRQKDKREKAEWDKFMDEEAKRFDQAVTIAKGAEQPWANVDGLVAHRFNDFRGALGGSAES